MNTQNTMENKMNELQGYVNLVSNEYPNASTKEVIRLACNIYEDETDEEVTEEMENKLKINA